MAHRQQLFTVVYGRALQVRSRRQDISLPYEMGAYT
jgi:hypothetical protein